MTDNSQGMKDLWNSEEFQGRLKASFRDDPAFKDDPVVHPEIKLSWSQDEAMKRGERPVIPENKPKQEKGKKTDKKSYPAYNGFNHVDPSPRIEQFVLILTSFLIPGLGLAADGCMTKIVSAISSLGNALKVVSKHCERIQCPNCYQWWISKRAFKLAVLVECYAKFTNERPIGVYCSVHPDAVKSWTWKDYGNFFRVCYTRMYKLGITGGIRVFHPFRVRDEVKYEFRKLGAKDSGGFWKMIRENVLNFNSWYSYVCLAPHIHALVFPSWMKENTTKDIVIGKYDTFETVVNTVSHIRYLLSHCGILTDGENEPASPFGVLHGWRPEEHLTATEIISIKHQVAEAMGLNYNEKKDDIEPVNVDEEDDKYDWIPIHSFADYSRDNMEFTQAFLDTISNRDYATFVGNVINLYNDRRSDHERHKTMRHVFLEDVTDIPDGFDVVDVELG